MGSSFAIAVLMVNLNSAFNSHFLLYYDTEKIPKYNHNIIIDISIGFW